MREAWNEIHRIEWEAGLAPFVTEVVGGSNQATRCRRLYWTPWGTTAGPWSYDIRSGVAYGPGVDLAPDDAALSVTHTFAEPTRA